MDEIANRRNLTRRVPPGYKIVIAVIVAILAVILVFSMLTSVPTGYTGILTTFGRVEEHTLEAGVHVKSPFQKVILMDNRVQKLSYQSQAFSSDIQQVDMCGSISYDIDKATAMNLYRKVGVNYSEILVMPRLIENSKTVFSSYTAEELISSRDRLSNEIKARLATEMSEYGVNIISVSIEDIDFTDAFTNAVEAKQVAEQTKLKAATEQAQKTMEAQQEAERKRIKAENDAEVARIEADAQLYSAQQQADADRYAGEQKAAANKVLSDSITDALIEYYKAQRWDGQLPMYTGGSVPVINMGAANTEQTTPAE